MTVHYKMQKWSKFQYQSRVLKSEIILLTLLVGLTLALPHSFAQNEDGEERQSISRIQQFSVDEKKERLGEIFEIDIKEQKIRLEITSDSDVMVTHIIETGFWSENEPRMIKILPGVHSELIVTDEDGDYYPFTWEDKTFEDSEYVILQTKLRNYDLHVKYELKNFLEVQNSLWMKNISLPTDVEILFDERIDVVYTNSRPIDVSSSDGLNCIGCNMKLEFFNEEKFFVEEVITEEAENEVKFWSNGQINNFEFNNEIREIYFKTEIEDQLITLEIPLDLILFPFEVYLTQEEDDILDQIDKIRKTEFGFNQDSVKLSIRPTSVGEISIIGATQDEHNAVFEKMLLEQKPIENPMEGIEESGEKVSSQEVFESWGESTENKSPDYTIILAIIGIIAAIIIGVIVKVKKN